MKSKSILVSIFLILNSLPIISGLVFLNYATFKILNVDGGSKLAAIILAINSLVSIVNVIISKKLENLDFTKKLFYAALLTFISSLLIALYGYFPPTDIHNYLIFVSFFFFSCLLQQTKFLLLFKVPYILNSEKIFSLNKSTSFSLIIERTFRGLAPGIALTFLNYDWLQTCFFYAFINIFSIAAIYILSKYVLSNISIDKKDNKSPITDQITEKEEAYYKKISYWNNVYQLIVNGFLAPATFVFIIAIKSNSAFHDWVMTPLTLLYGGVLITSLGAYSKLLKRFIQPTYNPLKVSAFYILLLGIFFVLINLVSNLLFWVISLCIGLIYGLALLINSNSVLKAISGSKYFLKYVSYAQLFAVLSTVPSFILSGYAIEYGIEYSSLFIIIGFGCIVSSIVLYLYIPKETAFVVSKLS